MYESGSGLKHIRKMPLTEVLLLKPLFLFPFMVLPTNFLAQVKVKTSPEDTGKMAGTQLKHEPQESAH